MKELDEYLHKKNMLDQLRQQWDKLNDQIKEVEREKDLHQTQFLLTEAGSAMPDQFVYQFGRQPILVKKRSTFITTEPITYFTPSEP